MAPRKITCKRQTNKQWQKYWTRNQILFHGRAKRRSKNTLKKRKTYLVTCNFCSKSLVMVRQRCVQHLIEIHQWDEETDDFASYFDTEAADVSRSTSSTSTSSTSDSSTSNSSTSDSSTSNSSTSTLMDGMDYTFSSEFSDFDWEKFAADTNYDMSLSFSGEFSNFDWEKFAADTNYDMSLSFSGEFSDFDLEN